MAHRATTTTNARATATTPAVRAVTAVASKKAATTTVPTTPPTTHHLNTVATNTLYTTFANQVTQSALPTAATARGSGAVAAASSPVATPSGVWAATVGLASLPAGNAAQAAVSTSPSSSTKKFPLIPVAAGAGGGLVVLILVVVAIVCCVKRKKARRASFTKRTTNLRNSFISSPLHLGSNEKFASAPAYGATSESNFDAYRPPATPNHHYEPSYTRSAYDGHSLYDDDRFQPPKPISRFAGGAQDRGYGVR